MARWAATIKKLRAESMKLYRHELEHGKEEEEDSGHHADYHTQEDTQQQLAEEEEEEEEEEEPAEEREERPTPKTNRGRKQITTERRRTGPSKGTHPKKSS
ncbi:Titin [Balamuthia mandrillaris]